jgi:3-methyladenine DNA glycosylase AlkD
MSTRRKRATRPSTERQTAADVLAQLRSLADPSSVAGMARFGIATDGRYGLSAPVMRKVAKEIGRNHALALELWQAGQPEARHIACMIADPEGLTSATADRWARDLDSWDICDNFAYALMSYTPMRWAKPAVWARSKREFVRRAAFALIAGVAVHDKAAPDAAFTPMLDLIAAAADDDRNFVKKAVNWALRQIGKRNRALNRAAIAAAMEIQRMDSRAARWTAADALRELRSEAVQSRLTTPRPARKVRTRR